MPRAASTCGTPPALLDQLRQFPRLKRHRVAALALELEPAVTLVLDAEAILTCPPWMTPSERS
jgi:hypothetical protein